MTNNTHQTQAPALQMHISEFWSGDLGLTLVTISLAVLIFVITPLREAGLPGRLFCDLVFVTLMVFGALTIKQSRLAKVSAIALILSCAAILAAGRLHPTLFLHQLGSFLLVATLLLYVRIVLLVMFRGGPITWSRIQGGVCAYLLLGMAWASAFQLVEQLIPGSFNFVTAPTDIDQLTSKLIYFSFGTLTTVGSSITPLLPFARSLTIAEAIVGQLFPATLIGALVAMAMASRNKS
jgi:hypothetical protein